MNPPKAKLKISYPEILPISGKRAEIIRLIKENQIVIVCGTTGSGKTTQLPKMAMEAGASPTDMAGPQTLTRRRILSPSQNPRTPCDWVRAQKKRLRGP